LLSAGQDISYETLKDNPKEWGRFAESAVGAHLINSSIKYNFNVYYWNNSSYEVDYVIEKNDKVIALEVKSGHDSFNKGLALFDKEFHPNRLFIIGTAGIPFADFLKLNPAELFNL
jgi:predicted AAA+ superfamily ATPase